MAYSADEIKYLQTLSDDMVKRIESTDTSSSAAVSFSKIGQICTRAIADDAALAAKRSTRTGNVTKFQTARQNRVAAKKKGGAAATPQPAQAPTQGTGTAQQRACQQALSKSISISKINFPRSWKKW